MPAVFTFNTAIKRKCYNVTGDRKYEFKKILGTTEATIMDHIDQERSNLQSTKIVDVDEPFPEIILNKIGKYFCGIADILHTKTAYINQTNTFPCQ